MTDPQNSPYGRIAILGAGAWGSALAVAAHASGRQVTLWVREPGCWRR
jgi:glycerol-3-phosphate dehydrogenase (NAD(P)+)